MKKLMMFVAGAYVLFAARAAAVYVSPTGTEGASGDSEHPIKSINAAIAMLGAEGGTIYLAKGDYVDETTEGDSALTLSAPIVIEGLDKNPAQTTIKRTSGSHRLVLLDNKQAALRYVTIANGLPGKGKAGGGIYITDNGGTVDSCIVTGCQSGSESRAEGGGGIYMKAGRVVNTIVEKCKTNNMRQFGSGIFADGGVIAQCVIRECSTTHHASSCNGNGAVALRYAAVMINSAVVNNVSCLETGVYVDDLATGGVFNTVVYGNRLCGSSHSEGCTRFNGIFCDRIANNGIKRQTITGKSTIAYCAVDAEPYNNTCVELADDPFVDFANKDYSQAASSQLVDKGNDEKSTTHLLLDKDFYGQPRYDKTIDIGVSELQRPDLYIEAVAASLEKAVLPAAATIEFSATVVGGEGKELSYTWDFGDGSDLVVTDVPNASHEYVEVGSYEMKVELSDGEKTFLFKYPRPIEVARLEITFAIPLMKGCVGVPVPASATIVTATSDVLFSWDFGDGTPVVPTTDTEVSHVYAETGRYTISVTADAGKDGSVSQVFEGTMDIVRKDLYVSPSGTNAFPYDTPETAARKPETAVAAAVDGCTVHVAPSTYNMDNIEVIVNRGIRVVGEGATPDDVWLKGAATNDKKRNMQVTHPDAFVTNMKLYGGFAGGSPGGGNLYLSAGVVSNCVLSSGRTRNNGAESGGAKVTGGLLTHCIITNSYNGNRGAGICLVQTGGRVSNCLITRNWQSWDSTRQSISLCAVSGGMIDNCTIADCWIMYSTPDAQTANKYKTTDKAFDVTDNGRSVNNVIAGIRYCGWSIERNAVVAYDDKIPRRWDGTAANFVNCATDDATPINDTCFVGTLEKGSLFADYANKDLTPGAVTKNKGIASDDFAFPSVDLAGNPRVHKVIDIGCYECQSAKGLSIIIR